MLCIDSIIRNSEYIYYIKSNSKKIDSPLIILLHGFPDNAFGWDLQIEKLKENFNIIAPFMPGTLNNKKIAVDRISGNELKQDLIAIIEENKKSSNQKIFIISHDLGCFLSVSILKELESHIAGIIHINGMGIEQFTSRKYSFSQWLKSYYVILAQFSITHYIVHTFFPKFFLNTIYNLSLLKQNDEIRLNNPEVLNPIPIYRHLFKSSIKTLGKEIKKIKTPTLFIWGNKDAFLNIPNKNEVEKFYNNGTIRILNGGHWVMRSNSKHVNRIILKTINNWENLT